MRCQLFRKTDGFSLIEVLTSLMVISLVLGLLLSGLVYANTLNKKTATNQKLFYSERYIELYFQKQVLKSEKIYFKNSRVYLQDLESPDLYYNYYLYSNGYLKRYKVYKDGLNLIEKGQTSQFIDGIEYFSMTLGPDNEIILKYRLVVDGKSYYRETTIAHGRMVEFV